MNRGYTVTYSGNNRTHMIRIPESGAFRTAPRGRCPQAGILAAGLDGVANKRDPVKRLDINMYTRGHTVGDCEDAAAQSLGRATCTRCERSAQARTWCIPACLYQAQNRGMECLCASSDAMGTRHDARLLKSVPDLCAFYCKTPLLPGVTGPFCRETVYGITNN